MNTNRPTRLQIFFFFLAQLLETTQPKTYMLYVVLLLSSKYTCITFSSKTIFDTFSHPQKQHFPVPLRTHLHLILHLSFYTKIISRTPTLSSSCPPWSSSPFSQENNMLCLITNFNSFYFLVDIIPGMEMSVGSWVED